MLYCVIMMKGKKRNLVLLVLMLSAGYSGFAQTPAAGFPGVAQYQASGNRFVEEAYAEDGFVEATGMAGLDYPEFAKTLMLNSILPGIAQLQYGDRGEGIRLMSASLLCTLAGNGILAGLALTGGSEENLELGIYKKDNRTYLFPPPDGGGIFGSGVSGQEYLYDAGLILSLWGSLFSAYSSWAFYRDYTDTLSIPERRTGRESLGELLAAPYRKENLLSWNVFPFFPMTVMASLDYDDLLVYKRFFEQDTVNFLGWDVNPFTGLALNTALTAVLVHANATLEEILFRGVSLESNGLWYSSVSFGAAHLPNMLMPGVSVEDTIMQTVFALLFGFYAADRTVTAGYHFEEMVALHFWHNMAAFTLGYLESGGTPSGFTWQVHFAY